MRGDDGHALGSQRSEIAALQSEIETMQTLLDGYLTRFNQTAEQHSIIRPDARVISAAVPSPYPSSPSRATIVMLGFVGAGMLGMILGYLRDNDPVEVIDGKGFRQFRGQVLDRDAEESAGHLAAFKQLFGNRPGHVDRDRETDAHVTAAAAEDRGVDANHLAIEIDQRSTRITRIDRGICLDEVLVIGDRDLRSSLRALRVLWNHHKRNFSFVIVSSGHTRSSSTTCSSCSSRISYR